MLVVVATVAPGPRDCPFLGNAMVRFVRLVASVLMLTCGVWLALAFVSGPQPSPPDESAATPVGDTVVAPQRVPRLIPDTSPPTSDTRALAEAAAVLAPLAELVAEPNAFPPPQPLPAVPSELASLAPPLESAYRSALDLPPPPLLDAHAPPPLVGGSTWKQTPTAATPVSLQMGFPGAFNEAPMESGTPTPERRATAYAVCDGDDLTSIATRFYGHPAAAQMVYEANRDRLPSPDLLPIGVVLVLPPPPEQNLRDQRPGGWIEPSQGG